MTHKSASTFCAEVRAPLVGALTLYCGDRGVAEELAQEALARAFQRWSVLHEPCPWTYATAFNLARSRFRRVQAERRAHARVAVLAGEGAVDPDTASAMAVRDAVRSLPDRQRQAIVCRYCVQLSVRETAAAMSCAEGTVKALTSQAIAGLRRAGLTADEPADAVEEEVCDHA